MEMIINLLLLFFMPLIFSGAITRVKSFWSGRRGPSIFQPFYDVVRLLKKGEVVSETSSFVFQVAPAAALASVITAGLVVPLAGCRPMFYFGGDFVAFACLFAVGRYCMVCSALDCGSSFEGMGASREASFSILVEPGFLAAFASLAMLTNIGSFRGILSQIDSHGGSLFLVAGLGAILLFIMLLVEGCRLPVDDPATHLELTMIHEVMILDNSGPGLAMITYSAAMKMFLISALLVNLFIPANLATPVAVAVFIVATLAVAVCVGIVESLIARFKMLRNPDFIFFMVISAVVLFALTVIGGKTW